MPLHPGGLETTRDLLALHPLSPGARVLDLGCASGDTLRLLEQCAHLAFGIDREPALLAPNVQKGDLLALPYPAASFDAAIAECTLSICSDTLGALKECARVLRAHGVLLLSDVYFHGKDAPCLSLPVGADAAGWRRTLARAGFCIQSFADRTDAWKQYSLRCLWMDEDPLERWRPKGCFPRGARPGYFLMACTKGKEANTEDGYL